MSDKDRPVIKESCGICHGTGMVGELFPDETIAFPQGQECPNCKGKGYTIISRIGICPKCESSMVHYRLKGYVCPYCTG